MRGVRFGLCAFVPYVKAEGESPVFCPRRVKGTVLLSVGKLSVRRGVLWQSSGKWPCLLVGGVGRQLHVGSLGLESLVWERVSQRDKITLVTDRRWYIVTYRGFAGHQMKCMKSLFRDTVSQFCFYYQLEKYGPDSSPFILSLFFVSEKTVRWWWMPLCVLVPHSYPFQDTTVKAAFPVLPWWTTGLLDFKHLSAKGRGSYSLPCR